MLARAARRARETPAVHWHVALSEEVAARWSGAADLVFIDGDHSEGGCQLDWDRWHPLVAVGGRVAFHDARADRDGGRGLPGPTAVVARLRRDVLGAGWELAGEADRTVVLRRLDAAPSAGVDDR